MAHGKSMSLRGNALLSSEDYALLMGLFTVCTTWRGHGAYTKARLA